MGCLLCAIHTEFLRQSFDPVCRSWNQEASERPYMEAGRRRVCF